MADLIDRHTAIESCMNHYEVGNKEQNSVIDWCVDMLTGLPSVDAVEVVRCKGCKHQEKYFYADKRLKDGGRYIYGCDLAEGYSHVCLDDDFCSRGEQNDE